MYDNIKIGERPQIEYYKVGGISMVKLPYETTEVSPGIFSWREIAIRYFDFNYGGLVSALIGLEYSQAEMTALINNYLLDPKDSAVKKEFAAMQKCRANAKETAKKIVAEFGL